MSTTSLTTMRSEAGVVAFGTGTFVLHKLDSGAPAIAVEALGERTVEIIGYIIPAGEDAAARGAAMERAKRLLCRTVGGTGGFILSHGGKELHLISRTAPEFSPEAPFCGTDAAQFTIRARSAEDGAFSGAEVRFTGHALEGALVFPLGITENTVFALLSHGGTLVVDNPGDLPCGFSAQITAEGGEIESVSLALGGAVITVHHPLADGESLLIDTRTGQKNVSVGGVSVMADVDWDSVFFPLAPGENHIGWQSEGFGNAVMRLSFTPRYL